MITMIIIIIIIIMIIKYIRNRIFFVQEEMIMIKMKFGGFHSIGEKGLQLLTPFEQGLDLSYLNRNSCGLVRERYFLPKKFRFDPVAVTVSSKTGTKTNVDPVLVLQVADPVKFLFTFPTMPITAV